MILVYSTADALALRSSPEIPADASANLVNRYPVGAKFSVLESEADASAKIGKPGQWLHVQSEFGAFEGYVAAWFVERRDGEKVDPGPTLEERVAESNFLARPQGQAEKENEMIEDLNKRFTYHAPKEEQPAKYANIRKNALGFSELIDAMCPDSREKSLAIMKVEEAVMWANASIARNE